jgi:hypothetical protein
MLLHIEPKVKSILSRLALEEDLREVSATALYPASGHGTPDVVKFINARRSRRGQEVVEYVGRVLPGGWGDG